MSGISTFSQAVAIVLQHEGGYVNDPADPGGETNFGISKRAYPNLDIKNLTREKASAIYFTDYWLKLHLTQLPDFISPKVLDTEVLAGSWGIRILQRLLGLPDDGVIGPQTAISALGIDYRDAPHFLQAYRGALVAHYDAIVEAHPNLIKFKRGWDARALS